MLKNQEFILNWLAATPAFKVLRLERLKKWNNHEIKMVRKSITREEAVYTLVDGHFAIDCACGNVRGGIEISDADANAIYDLANTFRKPKHTFYANNSLVLELLYFAEENQNSLEIICNGCKREFLLTSESYKEIIDKINE